MPPAKNNNCYLNFLATHDGIGIRPLEGILKEADLNSCDEIIDLKRNEFKYANNFEIVKAIQETMTNIDNQINEKFAINSLISDSIRRLNKVSNFDNQIQDFNDKLINIQDEVDSLHYELSKYLEEIESDDTSLEKIQNTIFYQIKEHNYFYQILLPPSITKL